MNAPLSPIASELMSAAIARALRPRERLTVSQWADRHRILTAKQAGETGRWRTTRNPMLREIMDALSISSPVREVTVMKSSQVGVTEASVNWIGYIIEHAHYPAMVLMPTLESRDTWKAQKLNPLLTDTTCIRDILGALKSRDAANSKDMIDYPGGILFLAGGNSPSSYAQKSVRFLMMDDLDRFPSEIGDEGDPVELGRTRVKAFMRYKFLKASTPTLKGASLIEREYEAGDMRRFHVECPHCGERLVLRWSNVRADAQNTAAWYLCEHNGCVIEEHHKPKMLEGGIWIAEHPDRKHHRSYHISAIYAPIGLGPSWLDLMIHFKRVHKDPQQLKTFINSNLGESWEDQTDKLKPHDLAKRASEYAPSIIPPGCLAITMGIDTQDKWIEYTRLGWGCSPETNTPKHWIIDQGQIQGDTASAQVWDELQAEIHKPMLNSYGIAMRIHAAAIDSRGHRTAQVMDFVMRTTLRVRVYSVQGSTSRIGRAIAQSGSYPNKNRTGKVIKHGYCVWNVGTEHCKDFIYANLAADGERSEAERVFHFPQGLEDTYYHGLLSETYDPEKKRYVQRLGALYKRNEPLDTLVYAWAIGHHRDINIGRGRAGRPDPKYWQRLALMLEPATAEASHPREDSDTAQKPFVLSPSKDAPPPARSGRRRTVIKKGGYT
jgi:phage terminase large subunit GpA-like protein